METNFDKQKLQFFIVVKTPTKTLRHIFTPRVRRIFEIENGHTRNVCKVKVLKGFSGLFYFPSCDKNHESHEFRRKNGVLT